MTTAGQAHNSLTPPRVVGLDASRGVSGRQHRRKKRKQRIASTAGLAFGVGVLAGGGYIGWTIYAEQQADDRAEREQLQLNRQQRDVDELIVDLSDGARWNGPGAPAFGVGEDEAEIPAIVVTEP